MLGTTTQSLSKILNDGGLEQLSQLANLGFKDCNSKTKTALEPIQNGQTKGKGGYTLCAA